MGPKTFHVTSPGKVDILRGEICFFYWPGAEEKKRGATSMKEGRTLFYVQEKLISRARSMWTRQGGKIVAASQYLAPITEKLLQIYTLLCLSIWWEQDVRGLGLGGEGEGKGREEERKRCSAARLSEASCKWRGQYWTFCLSILYFLGRSLLSSTIGREDNWSKNLLYSVVWHGWMELIYIKGRKNDRLKY